ncbi:MAG: hypothetical protein H7296_06915 [Bacteroidia bacterium]|nr:hypothetical protein [Bacteroidia bacterium]
MKQLRILMGGTMFLTLLVSAFSFAPPPGPSANGQGKLQLSYMNGETATFSFHASKDAAGNVSGSWEARSPGQDCRQHGTITCLTVLPDGKTAIMSGEVTKSDGTCLGYGAGTPIWFRVVDNGEGSNAAPDTFTDYYFFAGNCGNFGVTNHPITGGNIQVKP